MKLYIAQQILDELETASTGTAVVGTHDPVHQVATVTGIRPPVSSGHPGPVGEADRTRQILGVVDSATNGTLLSIRRGEGLEWRGSDGTVVELQVFDNDQYFKRTPFDPVVLKHLREARVLIVGMGSVGAPMGLELAKSGVGTLIAVDKDQLEVHNCMRHVLGSAYIGWPKATAFAHYLKEHAPSANCIAIDEDLFGGNRGGLRNLMEQHRPTMILAVTDSLRIQYLCQLAALYYQVPLMAVWCDNNAVEGEIFMWEPGQAGAWKPGRPQRGCYACMRDPETATITRSQSFDYSSDDPDTYGGEPALGTFINRISNIATIILTAWLLRTCPVSTRLSGVLDEFYDGKGLQYIRLGGPYPFEAEGQITASTPWGVEWYRVLKREGCTFCIDPQSLTAHLFPDENPDEAGADDWDVFEE